MRIGGPVLGPVWLITARLAAAALFLFAVGALLGKRLQARRHWRHDLLYFRLIADLGPAPALTVTFLIPLFGVLWGHLFLDEAVGWHTVAGGLTVLLGTALVTGWSPRGMAQGNKGVAGA